VDDNEIKFEIVRQFGAVGSSPKGGWTKELNLVSWNEREPKFDLREWAPDHSRMGKGVTLSRDEALALSSLLASALKDA
jgi:hypothetical protein